MANIIEENVLLSNCWEKLPYGGYLATFARINRLTGEVKLSYSYNEDMFTINSIPFKTYQEFLDYYEKIKSFPDLDTSIPSGELIGL